MDDVGTSCLADELTIIALSCHFPSWRKKKKKAKQGTVDNYLKSLGYLGMRIFKTLQRDRY